jgi:hypothetical protein
MPSKAALTALLFQGESEVNNFQGSYLVFQQHDLALVFVAAFEASTALRGNF